MDEFIAWVKKYTSRDFLLVVAVGIFAIASGGGWLTGAKINQAADRIQDTSAALPRLLDALMKLLDANGPLVVFALAVWAYIKRKAKLKENVQQADAQAKIMELKAKLIRLSNENEKLMRS